MTAPALRFFPTSCSLLVAELVATPEDVGAGVLRVFLVRNSQRLERRDRRVVMTRVAADGINAGYPQWRCECGLENCRDVMAALEYVGGPRTPNPCLDGPGPVAA